MSLLKSSAAIVLMSLYEASSLIIKTSSVINNPSVVNTAMSTNRHYDDDVIHNHWPTCGEESLTFTNNARSKVVHTEF